MWRENVCKHYAATYSGGVCSVRNQYGQAVPVVQAVCARCASCVRKRVRKQKCVQVCCRVNFILFVYATRVQVVQAPAIVSLRIFFVSQTFFRIAGVLYLVPF